MHKDAQKMRNDAFRPQPAVKIQLGRKSFPSVNGLRLLLRIWRSIQHIDTLWGTDIRSRLVTYLFGLNCSPVCEWVDSVIMENVKWRGTSETAFTRSTSLQAKLISRKSSELYNIQIYSITILPQTSKASTHALLDTLNIGQKESVTWCLRLSTIYSLQ